MLACVLTTKSPKNKVNKFNSELEAPPQKKKARDTYGWWKHPAPCINPFITPLNNGTKNYINWLARFLNHQQYIRSPWRWRAWHWPAAAMSWASYLTRTLGFVWKHRWDWFGMFHPCQKAWENVPLAFLDFGSHYHVLVHQISFCILKSRSFKSGCESYGGILANEMSINGQNVMSDDLRGTEALKHGALRVFRSGRCELWASW